MREILFRGKRTDNGEWTEGYVYWMEAEHAAISYPYGDAMLVSNVYPETVSPYIGVTDRNGRKIFEGDIILYCFNSPITGVIRLGEYKNPSDNENTRHVGFYVDWGIRKDKLRADIGYWNSLAEVIGNIYDNPELASQTDI